MLLAIPGFMTQMPQVSARKPRLHELVAVPIDLVPRNQALDFPLYVKISGSPVLLRPQGDSLSGERADRLKQKVANLFVPHDSFGRFLDGMEGREPLPGSSLAVSLRLRDLLGSLADGFSKSKEHQVRTLRQIENFSERLAETLSQNPENAKSLIRKSNESELYFTNHNLNVAVYSAMIGLKLGLPFESIKKLVMGAVLHNVGNIFVSPNTLFKAGPLEREEWQQMQNHTATGAQLLESLGVSKDVVLMVLQHHERMDGKGYPFAVAGIRIHLFARICAIADVYDALTSRRPYKAPVNPETAITIMRGMVGKFDTSILRTFER